MKENFVKMLESSINSNWDLPAFSDYKGEALTYGDISREILKMHYIFRKLSVKKGDKIALLGKNSVNWAIVYLATVSYGAVIVPILPDFHASDVHHIVNHSDSVLLFALEDIYENLNCENLKEIIAIFSLENLSLLYSPKKNLKDKFKSDMDEFRQQNAEKNENKITFSKISNNDLHGIIYTSGTTGFSKGVMLTNNNFAANVVYAQEKMKLEPGDTILSFLPIAHTFGCTFEFLFPFCSGCHITFLNKIPSPRIILKAFGEVKPRLILSVPLIIEKIYNKQIKPTISKALMKVLLGLPGIKNAIYTKIRKKLVTVFGGNFREIVIGGAPLNDEVETFFKKIKFPFTIGYGMTECAPLISYANWENHKSKSVGETVFTMQAKIDSEDSANIVGEIMVKGENLMQGYYKEEKITSGCFEDGWLHTGDLGLIDADNYIYIKGRSKSMILGPSGQNIFPEEIESKLNNLDCVQESLLVKKENKLIALIYPDFEKMDAKKIEENELESIMKKNLSKINKMLPAYSKISKLEIFPEEFEKTPTKKVKRFLYNK